MVKASALVLLTGLGVAWALSSESFQSSAIERSHNAQPAPIAAVAAEPAAANHYFMKIAPAEVDAAPNGSFAGSGDYSGGAWEK
jgi:hypothetical protein